VSSDNPAVVIVGADLVAPAGVMSSADGGAKVTAAFTALFQLPMVQA
jgi:hypothetical protein